MITVRKVEMTNGDDYYEISGESTDTKPSEKIGVNSMFLELDTGDFYYFDGENWAKVGG